MKVAAVFVAAGNSSRMGEKNKLLLNYLNSTLVQQTLHQLEKSAINKIKVVTGFEAVEIKKVLNKDELTFSHNPNYKLGLTSSIQTGIKALSNQFDGYMIALSDLPYLTYKDYNIVLNAFQLNYKKGPLIVVPELNDCFGHPIIFSKEFKADILSHKKPNGCKAIIQKNNKFVKKVLLNNINAFKDIDLPEDYQKLIDVRAKPGN